jgi:hypothetical protein
MIQLVQRTTEHHSKVYQFYINNCRNKTITDKKNFYTNYNFCLRSDLHWGILLAEIKP